MICLNCGKDFVKFRGISPFTETCIKCIKKSIHIPEKEIIKIINAQDQIINPNKNNLLKYIRK